MKYSIERTLVIIKPDAVYRCLVGEIITRFEKKGLKIVAMKMIFMDSDLAQEHYVIHKGKPFYKSLIEFITSGPSVVMVLEGKNAIEVVRKLMGATEASSAFPGTIRGDMGLSIQKNLVHGSDSAVSAKREIAIFFKEEEILDYKRLDEKFLI